MVSAFIEKLKNESVKREDLTEIIAAIREDATLSKSLKTALGEGSLLLPLLSNEDAKTRKNAAKLIGLLKINELSKSLFEAYRSENTLFVRPSMLEALCELKDRDFTDELGNRLKELEKSDIAKDEQKHLAEEIKLLREYTGAVAEAPHTFSGYAGPAELILYTSKGLENLTVEKVKALNPRIIPGGVRVSASFLRDVLPVRTVEEILFLIPEYKPAEFTPEAVAEALAASRLYAFLDRRHKEQGRAYRFRAELRTKLDSEKKISFTKKFIAEFEEKSDYKFVNSKSDYEIEIRIIERKDRKADCLLKILTIKDERFAYRKESIAAGLKPVVAATALAFAAPFLSEEAQVFDPFCGVGTLLIERAAIGKVKNLYGTDTFGPAIDKARKNTAAAGLKANYVNRNFFDFHHEYRFDEIITELPYLPEDASGSDKAQMKLTYRHFLEKALEHLAPGGVMVVLVKHMELLESNIERFGYTIKAKTELGNKETLYVLKLEQS